MIKSIFKAALTAGLCALIASCGAKSNDDNTLKILMPGERPAFFDEVVDEAQKRLLESGAGEYDLQFEFVAEDEYSDTLYVKLLAGREYDIVCSLSENEFETYRDMEVATPIGDYILHSDNYTNLKALYPDALWAAQENRYGGIYGIPSMNMYCKNIDCLYYKSEFADAIESEADLYQYISRCHDRNIAPLGIDENAGVAAIFEDDRAELLKNHILRFDDAGYEAYILLDEDNKSVVDIAFINEPEPENETLRDTVFKRRAAYEDMLYLCRNAGAGGAADFVKGEVGAFLGYITSYATAEANKEDEVGGAFVPFSVAEGELYTDFTAYRYNFVPFTSKKTEKALAFLEWLASDVENQYLFVRGIEGKTWERLSDERYRIKDGNYNFRGGFLLDNPNRRLIIDLIPENAAELERRASKLDEYVISPLSGFRLDISKVSKQVSRATNVMTNDKRLDYCNGRIADPAAEFLADYKTLSAAQEDIKAELKIQIEEFLNNSTIEKAMP